MVTLSSQNLTEFDLHARAILGLPVPSAIDAIPAASTVILADRDSEDFGFEGVDAALSVDERCDIRIFGKPATRPYRRMAVALAKGKDTDEARKLSAATAREVRITYS